VRRVIRLDLEYQGTRYRGFARQPGQLTVQAVVESALGGLVGHPVTVMPAGRTDAGVHALGQVVSFRTNARLPAAAVSRALRARLPSDIVALESREAPPDFDARRSARSRSYRYSVLNRELPSLWWRPWSLHLARPLDLEALRAAAVVLVGRRDFSSFVGQAAQQPDSSPIRHLLSADWRREGDLLHFECRADAFARHMVRNMVGTMLEVGRGRLASEAVAGILAARDRGAAGPTAPAHGLTLMHVEYDDEEGPRR
jgi:tRNA pseudouridine38-40 synthase